MVRGQMYDVTIAMPRYLPNTFALRERLETKAMRKIAKEEDEPAKTTEKDKDNSSKGKGGKPTEDLEEKSKAKPNSEAKKKESKTKSGLKDAPKAGSFKDMANKVRRQCYNKYRAIKVRRAIS